MSPVPATVPADAVLRTINSQDDYSFFLLLVGVHHSTIRPTDLRLSASKSVAPQKVRTVGRAGRPMTSTWDRYPSKSSVRCSTAEWQLERTARRTQRPDPHSHGHCAHPNNVQRADTSGSIAAEPHSWSA